MKSVPVTPSAPESAPAYGANNKLVTPARMAVVRERLKEILAERQAAKEAVERIIAEADNDQMSINEFIRSLAKRPLDKGSSK
jgi:hypothetical protein